MRVIQVSAGKTLKLSNVLIRRIEESEWNSIETLIEQSENYLKSKGKLPVGPLIQHTITHKNEDGGVVLEVYLLRQANGFIVHVDPPYKMEPTLRVKNCLYAHYIGPESKLKVANDKISVYAFEHELEIKSENYTVFVDQKEGEMVVDLFVEIG